jgi:hypothetical protein
MKISLTFAALVVLCGAAQAGTKTTAVSLDGHCDVLMLQIDKTSVVGADDPDCDTGFGIGYVGKVKGFGKAIVAGAHFGEAPSAEFVIRLSYPLVTGGNWDLAITSDGTTFTPFESGTYTVEGTAAKGARGATPVAARAAK